MKMTTALLIVLLASPSLPGDAEPVYSTPPTASGVDSSEFGRHHAAYVLATAWIGAIERFAADTNAFPQTLADMKATGLSAVDPWGRPIAYRQDGAGSYVLEIATTSGRLTYVRLAFTRFPTLLPDSDKLDAFLLTMKNLRHALDSTYFDENEYPDRLEELPTRHFPTIWPLSTPWGMPVSYSRREPGVYVLGASTPYGPLRIDAGSITSIPERGKTTQAPSY